MIAEGLVDMCCRLGIPDEILTDLGTRFTLECMREESRPLKIKILTMVLWGNLTERLVKLKRLYQDQPKYSHRFMGPLLFDFCEAPQESTGFAPFELLYGRTINQRTVTNNQRNMEIWTEEDQTAEIRNSYQYVFELREKLEGSLKIARNFEALTKNIKNVNIV